MKLWRRRPLSVDLTQAEEMPPSVVYISPSNNAASKRSSLFSNEVTSKPLYLSEVTSFNFSDKYAFNSPKNNVDDIPLQSFRDYNNIHVSFDDGTMRSSKLSNKTYLTPVSSEWLPVKDVMKIKRSASVPFQSKQSTQVQPQIPSEASKSIVKTHTSLAEKIRTLFRTRSHSHSSKTVLTPITEIKSNKVSLRNSRSRTKNFENCKSMYESPGVHDGEFSDKLNHALRDYGKKASKMCTENSAASVSETKKSSRKISKKDKSVSDFQRKVKECQVAREQQKFINSKGFSDSVVSHTASSAAKVQKLKSNERQIDKRMISMPCSSKYESPVCRDLSQSITATNYDKKTSALYKSSSLNNKISNKEEMMLLQRRECSKDKVIDITEQNTRTGPKTVGPILSQRPEEDDYVRLAEIDLCLPPSYSVMAQSIHEAIISGLSKSNHEYENIDLRDLKTNPQHQVLVKYTNSSKEVLNKPPDGQQKKRPISCIAVVESDNCRLSNRNEKYFSKESPKNNFPKSPYLSQYTKLYSLKVTDGQIMYTQHSEPLDCDIMTRSQTSGPYKSSSMISKENSGKISIDSGLVEDLSMNFRSDGIIKT